MSLYTQQDSNIRKTTRKNDRSFVRNYNIGQIAVVFLVISVLFIMFFLVFRFGSSRLPDFGVSSKEETLLIEQRKNREEELKRLAVLSESQLNSDPGARCSDGTYANKCSVNKPFFCGEKGETSSDCSLCGCPVGKECRSNECVHFLENTSCNNKEYKMAFIFLVKGLDDVTSVRSSKLSIIKNQFAQAFYTATRDLATMDTSESDSVVVLGDDFFYGSQSEFLDKKKITKKFYETHEDVYDFISIFTTFDGSFKSSQHHEKVVQNIKGIGWPVVSFSEVYGSRGRLRGINFMGNIDNYSSGSKSIIRGLLHETGHQWCCYIGENFSGDSAPGLGIIQQGIHFYLGLQSPYEVNTPMGAHSWVSNEDGTFRDTIGPDITPKYHPFQLYLMGLLPEEEYGTSFRMVDAESDGKGFYNSKNASIYSEVSIRDIIKSEGERVCIE